ncbi:MAG: ASCH domain-containing protein [Pirellulaceae bacterium]
MNRSYRDGWTEIFGDRDDTHQSDSDDDEFNYVEPPVIDASEIDWKNTRALSIRQPYAELIMLGEKTVEDRGRATTVRGRIAIYASLSGEYLEEAEEYQLNPDKLPRGVIIGTVDLFDCDKGEWKLRDPQRLATPVKPTAHPQPVWFYPFGRD